MPCDCFFVFLLFKDTDRPGFTGLSDSVAQLLTDAAQIQDTIQTFCHLFLITGVTSY